LLAWSVTVEKEGESGEKENVVFLEGQRKGNEKEMGCVRSEGEGRFARETTCVGSFAEKTITTVPAVATAATVSTGGIFLINADGACCFHLAGVVGHLDKNPQVLHQGKTSCTQADLKLTREQILENFALWRDSERAHCFNDAELEKLVDHKLYEPLEPFLLRTAGLSKGKDIQGSAVDLALYSFSLDVRVVVVLADMIRGHSSDTDLEQACSVESLRGEREKRRCVCAVLSDGHYELGIVRGTEVKAIFDVGADWDQARLVILKSLREVKKLPKPDKVFWTPPDVPVSLPKADTPRLDALLAASLPLSASVVAAAVEPLHHPLKRLR